MSYDVNAARAERAAARTTEPFTFVLDGKVWTLKDPEETPGDWMSWSSADYGRRFADLVVEPDFPTTSLTTGDKTDLVKAWLGSTPGE